MSKTIDYKVIYKNNNFSVDGYIFTIDSLKHTPLDDKTFAIITAYNPDNNLLDIEENIKRNNELQNTLTKKNYSFEEAIGFLNDHSEESFCIYNISFEEATELAKEHGQYSIFYHSKEISGYFETASHKNII